MKTPEKNKKGMQLLEALLCGMAGGAVFSWLGLPLAWMLGPLTTVILWNLLTKRTLYWPKPFKNGGQMLLGYSMGLSFTAESAAQIAGQLPSMTVSTVLMVIFGLGIAFLAFRMTGINVPSAVMGTTPGGLSQMTMLSEEIRGADPTIVTFMQTIRMLAVTFMVPMLTTFAFAGGAVNGITASAVEAEQTVSGGSLMHLMMTVVAVFAGTALALRLRFPTPWILGPLITAAILTVSGFSAPLLPPLLMVAAQLLIGVYLGLSIRLDMLKDWKKLLPFSLVSGALMVGFALLLAYVLHLIHPMSMATAFLCIAPGGLPEMGVTAHEVGADVSMVAAYQLFRVFFILFLVPVFLRFAFGRQDTAGKTAESI